MPANPYRGLDFFDQRHTELFFGRERSARELLAKLREHRLVAVVGVAGAGKSSLVRAGLSQLHESGELSRPLCVVVPGEPLPMPGSGGLVLVVDQFERVFAAGADPASAIERLLAMARHDVSVVIALRAEHYATALAHAELAAAMEPMTLLPMTERELLHAIEEPARRRGCLFEPGLAQRMAADVPSSGDLRPLGYALHALWERDAAAGTLTAAGYDALAPSPGHGERPKARRRSAAALLAGGVLLVALAASGIALLGGRGDDGPTASRAIAAAARPALDRRFDTGLLLSLEAWRTAGTIEARDSALAALQRTDRMVGLLRNRTRAEVSAVAFGGGVLAATDGTAVTLFDVPRRRRLATRLASPDGSEATAVAVGPRGDLVAAAFGGDVLLHRRGQGVLRIDGARVTALAFSPDGALLAGAGPRRLRVWEASGRTLHEDALPRDGAGAAADVAFDASGRSLAEVRGGRLTVWATKRWERRRTIDVPAALRTSAVLSPDLRHVAGGDRSLWLWRVGSRRARRLGGPEATFPRAAAAFSPDSRSLAVPARDGTIRLWDVATGRATGRPLTGGRDALSVAWDRATLISGGRSGLATLWSPAGANALATRVEDSAGARVAVGRTGALAWSDGIYLNLRARPGAEPLERGVYGQALEFATDGRALVTAEPTRVRVFDLGLQERATHIAGAGVTAIATGPGNVIAYGDDAGQVHLWPEGTFGELRSSRRIWSTAGWLRPVRAVAVSPNGRIVAATISNAVRLYGVASGHLSDGPVLRGHDDLVTGAAFSPDGRLLATSARDATVRLWSPRTGAPVGAPLWAGAELVALAFSSDGRTLAGAEAGGALRLWDVAARRALGEPLPADGATDLAFAPDGRTLVSANGSALVRWSGLQWARRPGELARRLCAIAGREITREEWRAYVPGRDWRPTCRTR